MAIRKTSTNRLVDICMRIADETERNAHEKEQIYVQEYGMGYRCITDGLRNGIKAVLDMQLEINNLKDNLKFARMGEKNARDFLLEIFGDAEVDTLNDEYKAKIKEFVQSLDVYKEVEDEM